VADGIEFDRTGRDGVGVQQGRQGGSRCLRDSAHGSA
jgi:hypothetical protein